MFGPAAKRACVVQDYTNVKKLTTFANPVDDSYVWKSGVDFSFSLLALSLLGRPSLTVSSRDLRLPGKDISSPEVFPFGTPYRDLYDTLKRKDETFFLKNNLLRLAARNATIKAAPQRFQDIEGPDMADFDVVLCFEARVFYSVVEGTNPCATPASFQQINGV